MSVLDDIMRAAETLNALPPDPLNGATELICAENMKVFARKLAGEDGGLLRPRLEVRVSPYMPPGHIWGQKMGKLGMREICLIIGPETPTPPRSRNAERGR